MSKNLIVITRSEHDGDEWQEHFESLGMRQYHFPTIEIVPVEPTEQITQAITNIEHFDRIVFTSKNGVHSLQTLADRIGIDLAEMTLPPVAAVGPHTAKAAEQIGFTVSYVPKVPESKMLGADLSPTNGKRILILRANIASEDLACVLSERGAEVTDLSVYETQLRTDPDPVFSELLQKDEVTHLTFASPSAVHGFVARLSPADLSKAREIPAIAIGRSVTRTLKKVGFLSIHTALSPDIDGMISAMIHTTHE